MEGTLRLGVAGMLAVVSVASQRKQAASCAYESNMPERARPMLDTSRCDGGSDAAG